MEQGWFTNKFAEQWWFTDKFMEQWWVPNKLVRQWQLASMFDGGLLAWSGAMVVCWHAHRKRQTHLILRSGSETRVFDPPQCFQPGHFTLHALGDFGIIDARELVACSVSYESPGPSWEQSGAAD